MKEDAGAVEIEYLYRGRRPVLMLIAVGAIAAGCLAWAVLDRGPIRGGDGRVTVDESAARIVRWSVAGAFSSFVVFVGRWTWIDVRHPRRIAIGTTGVLVPRARWGWVPVEEFIPYTEMSDFRATVVPHLGAKGAVTRFHILGPGVRFTIVKDNLPDGAFDEVCRQLSTRAAAAQWGLRPGPPT